MTFNEIKDKFLNGVKIRRASWNKDYDNLKTWYEYVDERILLKKYDDKGIMLLNNFGDHSKILSLNDILADDWEIIS